MLISLLKKNMKEKLIISKINNFKFSESELFILFLNVNKMIKFKKVN